MADFNVPFPYPNYAAQLQASMQNPTPGSYLRWGGTGTPAGAPAASGGLLGPMPGAVAGPGGTYPMPKDPQYVDPSRVPVGDPTFGLPSVLDPNGMNAVGPAGFQSSAMSTGYSPAGATAKVPLASNTKMAGGTPGLFGMDPANFGAAPSIPGVAGSTQRFSANFMPNAAAGPSSLGAQQAHYLAMRPNSLQAQRTRAMPQSFTPGQFNQVAQRNPVLAEAMAAQGGQGYRDAIMQQNGWSNTDMNRFLNQFGSGATPGFGPDQMALLRAMGIA